MSSLPSQGPVQSTAGAVPMKNDKGDFVMQKVKVQRYVSGKRPDYAPQESSDEEDYEFGFGKKKRTLPELKTEAEKVDRRLRRLQQRADSDDDEDRIARHRRLREPEILVPGDSDDDVEMKKVSSDEAAEDSDDESDSQDRRVMSRRKEEVMEESEEEEEELDDEEIERRRLLLRQRAQQRLEEEEVLEKEEEMSEGESEEESSEYEEYSESDEEMGPRLKPVFVRKKDRITIQEKQREEEKQHELEVEAKKMAEERRRQTLKMVEDATRAEMEEVKTVNDAIDAVLTDEENDEEEYEAWKVRELKRIKRDREEKEMSEKERSELDAIHNMTEEERRNLFKQKPKEITNKASKGKYKFLQKYYHRGAFFLDEDKDIFKRDFARPTLEDHFDKTILPKVMQVKNFGRSGRTKYTHLVDQDTTNFESPWISETAQNLKFQSNKGGGMKQIFDRPSNNKRK
ncbi:microfibrillar-associated protein 1-like [Lineus longissimus]|uniref:microfibrillar-associated protein 1-like n=1 Tax=Lineus longissimus TaxID=88925 RepID=UPI002B4D9052